MPQKLGWNEHFDADGPNHPMCRSAFSILSYGELDSSEEQGLNLNSVLFTLDEGSRQT